jgi:hypothetical protein
MFPLCILVLRIMNWSISTELDLAYLETKKLKILVYNILKLK